MLPYTKNCFNFRHNEDMEKIMIKRHKEQRISGKDRENKKGQRKMENISNIDEQVMIT